MNPVDDVLPVSHCTGTTWFGVNKPSSVTLNALSGKTSQLPQPPGVTMLSEFLTIEPVAVAVAKLALEIVARRAGGLAEISNSAPLPSRIVPVKPV